ncbi:MAG: O-antigen ligase family protein [Clostridia bacterium]|nr:O-antigen ligase family protein [Clostridia bacterium]
MKINKSLFIQNFFIFIGCIFLIKPTCLPYIMNGKLNSIYMAFQTLTCIITIILYITRKKFSKITFFIVLYYVYQIAITLFKHGDLRSILVSSFELVCICIFSEIFYKKRGVEYISILSLVLELYVFINFLTLILYPDGLYKTVSTDNPNNWFLGYKNQLINFILPALCFSMINLYYNRSQSKKHRLFRAILVYSVAIITSIILWSAGTLIIIFMMAIFFMFHKLINVKVFNFRNYVIVNCVLTFSVVILRVQNVFSFIIVDILGKDITFTGRTFIWDKALKYIIANPIFGNGVEYYSYRYIKMSMNSTWLTGYAALHSHCRFLEVMYRGGIVLLGIYVVILIMTVKSLMNCKETMFSKILSISLFAYMTGMMTEMYEYSPSFFVMILMSCCGVGFLNNNTTIEKGERINAISKKNINILHRNYI